MKKALISPMETVSCIVGWAPNPDTQSSTKYLPEYAVIDNSARVAEVAADTFPVAPPLFWVDCADNVVADQWYYNTVLVEIVEVPPPPPVPTPEDQPTVSGAQPL